METLITRRIRLGALVLGISALLFVLFPLVRPFFSVSLNSSPSEFAAASQGYTSLAWVVAHLMAMVALILLVFGLLTLRSFMATDKGERRAYMGMVFGIAGITLILPTLGVEAYAIPVIAKAYLEGKAEIVPVLGSLYGGPDNMVIVLGLLLLAIGGILFALAIWSSASLPRWAGVILAAGLLLWFPLLPQFVRIADGILIGIGGMWLALTIWRNTERASLKASPANVPVPGEA